MASVKAELFLDCVDEPSAQFLALAVHRENAHSSTASDDLVAAASSFKRASLLGQPALELLTRHQEILQHFC
jgi:hypothetical protein